MKLVKLSCNQPSFRTINFNPNGLTLILGDKSTNGEIDSSINGVGKTQALRLVHFCLGAKTDSEISRTLKHAVPHWLFKLEIKIEKKIHLIERSGDSKILKVDDVELKYNQFLSWLNSLSVFPNLQKEFLSFRSLFSRFARVKQEDCLDSLRLYKETDYASLINNAYLLNIDMNLVEQKYNLKSELDNNNVTRKLLKKDSYLSEKFKLFDNPAARKNELENKIAEINKSLSNFTIADNYNQIENEVEELTQTSRTLSRKISALEFKIDNINKSLKQKPDINKDQLLELYEGLQQLFRPEALTHFENVQTFHNELTFNRAARLEKEKIALNIEISELSSQLKKINELRDGKLLFLKDNHALDEYLALNSQLSEYKDELKYINRYLHLDDEIKEQNLNVKVKIIKTISEAIEYTKSDPISFFNLMFHEITSRVYPKLNSGIYLSVNDSENNKCLYDLEVNLQTDSSDGISALKIMAYDWLIFNYGYHQMNMLWHDNRLFADIDPEKLAKWFDYVSADLSNKNKQYIVSINVNNFNDMKGFSSDTLNAYLDRSIAINLQGDKDSNKLMGITFDKPRKSSSKL